MPAHARLSLLSSILLLAMMPGAPARASAAAPRTIAPGIAARASAADSSNVLAAFTVDEAIAGDLNGDGDSLDAVVHVLEPHSGVRNLGLAVHQTCDTAPPVPRCTPAPPIVGAATVAFVVSEAAQGATDFTGDEDVLDDVVFVYDARRREVLSTSLAVAHGRTRSVSFITFAMAPIVVGDSVVFLVAEGEQGATDLNGDGDALDAVVHVFTAHAHRILGIGIAAPRIGFFGSPVLDAVGDGKFVTVSAGEAEQSADLNRDGDQEDVVRIEIQVQSGMTRLAR